MTDLAPGAAANLSPNLVSVTAQLAQAFIAKTLPKAEWTHHAHLRVGLWHVLHYPADQALDLVRERICAYNLVCGVANTATSGYHESITRFYLMLIGRFLASTDRTKPVDELAELLIANYGDHDLLLRYYSRECLFSSTARLSWVEPDITPLL